MSPLALFVVILAFAGGVVLLLTKGIQRPKKRNKIQIPPEKTTEVPVPGASSIFIEDRTVAYTEPITINDLEKTAKYEDGVIELIVAKKGKKEKKEPVKKTARKKEPTKNKEAKKPKTTKASKKPAKKDSIKKEPAKKPGRPRKDKGDFLLLS